MPTLIQTFQRGGRWQRRTQQCVMVSLVLALLLTLFPLATPAHATSPTDAFDATWARSDAPVASGAVARTWMWGPAPISPQLQEQYLLAPGDTRTVVYYDKSRMEVNDPAGDAGNPWYVTNGLLALEMILGERQIGPDHWQSQLPAEINIAGDQGFANGPSYGTFHDFIRIGAAPEHPAQPVGTLVQQRIGREGRIVADDRYAAYDVRIAVLHDLGYPLNAIHGIPAPFWEFMNARGVVQIDGQLVEDTLFPDPLYATGRPLIEPYWSEVYVGGRLRDVLIQCFERRCLTYTPDNPSGWQVESSNTGQHYYQWRYAEPAQRGGEILFVRTARNNEGRDCANLYLINVDGTNERPLLTEHCHIDQPRWSPDGTRVLFRSLEDLYVLDVDSGELVLLPRVDPWTAGWSPDSRHVLAVRPAETDGGPTQLLLLAADGAGEQVVWETSRESLGINGSLAWSRDGAWITFMHGNWQTSQFVSIIRADGRDLRDVAEYTLDADSSPQHVIWFPDGSALAVELVTHWSDMPYGHSGGVVRVPLVDLDTASMLIHGCLPAGATLRCSDVATAWRMIDPRVAPNLSGDVAALMQPMLDVFDPLTGRIVGSPGIHVLNLYNGRAAQLTHTGDEPSWSPSGDYLVFEHESTGPGRGTDYLISITSRDGDEQWVVARNALNPQWRPPVEHAP